MSARERRALYPAIEPYRHDRLKVGAGHEIYYEECGNRFGKPVVIVHGGPGGGCNATMRRYHDPERYRIVFLMRDVEEMSIEETALLLDLRHQTVSTRLHRARKLLKQALGERLATVFTDTFPFAGAPCDRLTQAILDRFAVRLLEITSH